MDPIPKTTDEQRRVLTRLVAIGAVLGAFAMGLTNRDKAPSATSLLTRAQAVTQNLGPGDGTDATLICDTAFDKKGYFSRLPGSGDRPQAFPVVEGTDNYLRIGENLHHPNGKVEPIGIDGLIMRANDMTHMIRIKEYDDAGVDETHRYDTFPGWQILGENGLMEYAVADEGTVWKARYIVALACNEEVINNVIANRNQFQREEDQYQASQDSDLFSTEANVLSSRG